MSYKSNETNKGKTWSKEEKDDLLKELLEKKSLMKSPIPIKGLVVLLNVRG